MTQEKQVPKRINPRKTQAANLCWLKKEPSELSKKQTKHIQANSMRNRGTKRSDLEKRRSSIRNRHGKQNETVADF